MGTRANYPSSPSGGEEAAQSLTTTTPSQSSQKSSTSSLPGRRVRTLFGVNRRFILTPVAVLLLGSVFYVYSSTTVAAAKENARRAREADGGSISWRREGMRRHGRLERVEERTLWGQLWGNNDSAAREDRSTESARAAKSPDWDRNPIEEGIRKAREDRQRAAIEHESKRSSLGQ